MLMECGVACLPAYLFLWCADVGLASSARLRVRVNLVLLSSMAQGFSNTTFLFSPCTSTEIFASAFIRTIGVCIGVDCSSMATTKQSFEAGRRKSYRHTHSQSRELKESTCSANALANNRRVTGHKLSFSTGLTQESCANIHRNLSTSTSNARIYP